MTPSGDTIAAIATAPGRSGVAIVRVSGPEAFDVALRLTGREATPGGVRYAPFRDPTNASRLLDSGLMLAFKSPGSYTGEDVIEFQCHGGSVTPRRILSACIAAGARLARRGEFTQRAFLNGKLSLDQAEAVLELINAKTELAADDALSGVCGSRMSEVRGIYDGLVSLSSRIEHALDVDEDELPSGFTAALDAELVSFRDRISRAASDARARALRREGALVVIAGPPNAGKSSLLNALLGENRAIVSDVAGTTRDSIEAWADFDGWPVRLVDTAGLRETSDAVEGEGVRRSMELMGCADVVIDLRDGTEGDLSNHHAEPAARQVLADFIKVASKSDLQPRGRRGDDGAIAVSSVTGEGLAELRHAVCEALAARSARTDDSAAAIDDRLSGVLEEARAALPDSCGDLVLSGNALRRSAEAIGVLLGATYSEDLLDTLFSRFCVGK